MWKGVSVQEVLSLQARLRDSKRNRAVRSLLRDCRRFLSVNMPTVSVKRDGGKVSEQTGLADKWIIATV